MESELIPQVKELEKLRERSPLYTEAIEYFLARNAVLARSAMSVYRMHGENCLQTIERILGFLNYHAGGDYLDLYDNRVRDLLRMQKCFNNRPSLQTLGASGVNVDRQSYNIALLGSIAFTNHRFEIMQQLETFLQMINRPAGRLSCIGIGTGYELMLASRSLKNWFIEGYDTDEATHTAAGELLEYFEVNKGSVEILGEFPLYNRHHDRYQLYDAIVFCEITEHLSDPLTALESLKHALKAGGMIFVTMAINIAQEDHIYWYKDIDSCRAQLKQAGLNIMFEWIAPASAGIIPRGEDRENAFRAGNYIAVVV